MKAFLIGLGLLWIHTLGTADDVRPVEGRPAIYPFDVTLGGQLAVVEGNYEYAIFARIADPVAKDAELVLGAEKETIFVNVFRCDAKGEVDREHQANPKIIMAPNADRVTLNQTMDQSSLEDGWYLMNVVLRTKGTSRVVFRVGAGDSAVEAPEAAAALDQSTPEGAVSLVFAAAKSGELATLKNLLPPSGKQDGDVEQICGVSDGEAKEQTAFKAYFSTGKVVGEARIGTDGNAAEVDFLFGPGGKKEETMNLSKEGAKWYLSSF